MPTYRPYTRVADLPANSRGEKTILAAHLDDAHATITDVIEFLTQATFSSGGVIIPGDVTNPTGAVVQVEGRLGVTLDAKTVVAVADQSVDLDAVATGIKCLVVIQARAGATTPRDFTDAATGEAITHNLLAAWGKVEYIEGDSSDYPAVPDDCVPVAEVTRTGGGITIDTVLDDPPAPAQAGLIPRGDTASRPAAPPPGLAQLYWDEDEGKLIAHDGIAWAAESGGGGASAFTDLTDTPADYSSAGGKLVAVNAGATALEFVTAPTIVTTFTGLTDTPGNYSGAGGQIVAVNSGATALEFVAAPDVTKVAINAQTGTTYTLVLGDAGKLVTLSNGSAITLTVPTNASVAFDVGTVIAIAQLGAGKVTVDPAGGVTITSMDDLVDLAGKGATASLTKVDTNTWLLSGGLA